MPVKFTPVLLDTLWPDDRGGTGMVLVQPDLTGLDDRGNGYRYLASRESHRLAILESALTEARSPLQYDMPHSHFTILSEYALPSDRFVDCEGLVQQLLPDSAVCIAGFDAMPRQVWTDLLQGASNDPNLMERQTAQTRATWVNCAAIWVKLAGENRVRRYLQAKMRQAALERNCRNMYRGDEVLYFQAGHRSFSQLICFDHIAAVAGPELNQVCDTLARELRERRITDSGIFFVLQANEAPNHRAFVDATKTLLSDPQHRFGIISYVNRAGATGNSRFYVPKSAWAPTRRDTAIGLVPEVYRRIEVPGAEVTEVSLRTGYPALHAVRYVRRLDMAEDTGGNDELFPEKQLYLISGQGTLQEADCWKAEQHELRQAFGRVEPLHCTDPDPLSTNLLLLESLQAAYRGITHLLCSLEPHQLQALLSTLWGDIPNPDYWGQERSDVHRLIQVLYLMTAAGFAPSIAAEPIAWTTADCGAFAVTVLAGDDERYAKSICEEVLGDFPALARRHLFIVMRHADGLEPYPEEIDFDLRAERMRGAGLGRTTVDLDDQQEFSHGKGEGNVDRPRLYLYDRAQMLRIAGRAASTLDFENGMKGALECLSA